MHAPESGGIHAENQFQLFAPLFNHGILYNRINWTRFHGPCRRGAANIPLSRTEKRDHHRPPIICRTKGERERGKKKSNGRIFIDSGLKLGILLIGWTSADPSIFPTPRNQRGTSTTFRKFDEYARNLAAFERGTERIILNYSLFFFFFILIISTIFKSVRKLNHSKTSPWPERSIDPFLTIEKESHDKSNEQGRVKCTCATLLYPPSSFQSRCTGLETKRDARNTRLSVCKQSRRLRRPHCTPFERNDTVQNEAEQRETLSHGSGAEREWNIYRERERR